MKITIDENNYVEWIPLNFMWKQKRSQTQESIDAGKEPAWKVKGYFQNLDTLLCAIARDGLYNVNMDVDISEVRPIANLLKSSEERLIKLADGLNAKEFA